MRIKYLIRAFIHIFFLVTIISCKEGNQKQKVQELVSKEVEPITDFRLGLAKLNINDQKIIFENLPNKVKSALWKDRLNEVLTWSFNPEQKEYLQELQGKLTASSYDTLVNASFKEYVKTWYESAITSFKDKDSVLFVNALYQLGEANKVPPILQQQIPLCNCEFNAWLQCPPWMDCKLIMCRRTRCGIANLWNCNAMCD